MESKKEILLANVKYAVQKYGLEGATVRNISDTCGINDSHLHRFYSNKEELYLDAYRRESDGIFAMILQNIDDAYSVPADFRSSARLFFHKTWAELLSDSARIAFCVYYYHSPGFATAREYHEQQVENLWQRLGDHYSGRQSCVVSMHALVSFLYDNAKSVTEGRLADTPETEEMLFEQFFSLLSSQYIREKQKT